MPLTTEPFLQPPTNTVLRKEEFLLETSWKERSVLEGGGEGMATQHIAFTVRKYREVNAGAQFTFIFVFVLLFETGFLCAALAVLELMHRPGWPRTHGDVIGIKGMHHHCQAHFFFFIPSRRNFNSWNGAFYMWVPELILSRKSLSDMTREAPPT